MRQSYIFIRNFITLNIRKEINEIYTTILPSFLLNYKLNLIALNIPNKNYIFNYETLKLSRINITYIYLFIYLFIYLHIYYIYIYNTPKTEINEIVSP